MEPIEKIDTSKWDIYYQDYTTGDMSGWTSANAQASITVENAGDANGNYIKFAPPYGNSRGAEARFNLLKETDSQYTVEVSAKLNGGNNQETQFAITGADFAYMNGNMNDGLASGYIAALTSTPNSTTWTVEGTGGETVIIPKDTWITIKAEVDTTKGKTKLEILNGEEVIYSGFAELNGAGQLEGIYIRGGRYNPVVCVDNIKANTGISEWPSEEPDIPENSIAVSTVTNRIADKCTVGTSNGDGTYTLDWWNYENFKGLKVTGDFDVTYKFKNHSVEEENWHNFALAFCTNLTRLNQLNEGEDLYIRSDNFISSKFTGSTVIPACNWSWDDYKTIMYGATVTLNAKRSGTTIVVDAEILGGDGSTSHYMITAVDCPTDDMMVYLGGENCYLEVSEVKVSTTIRNIVSK